MRPVALGALALLLTVPASAQSADRIVHQYSDDVKTAAGTETRQVDVVVDGETGASFQIVRDASGAVLSRTAIQPAAPNADEMDEARAVIAADADLASVMRSRPVHIDGGYILVEAEGMACGPGSRCLQLDMLNAQNRRERVRFVVVDLVSRSVVYPDFNPDTHGRMH